MTPARRAALRKAQLASAQKRRRRTNLQIASQQRRRRRAERTIQVAKVTAATIATGYGAYRMLTPNHRAWVDQKVLTTGRKIKSYV